MKLTVLECYWTPDGKSRAALVKLKPWFGKATEVLFTNTSGNRREVEDIRNPRYQPELAFNWFDSNGREITDHGCGPFSIGLSNQLDQAFSHARAAGTVKELPVAAEQKAFMEGQKAFLEARRVLRRGRYQK